MFAFTTIYFIFFTNAGISEEYKVYRGKSKHPLYITTHDYNLTKAKLLVENLEGEFRIPNIILKVDKLSRNPE